MIQPQTYVRNADNTGVRKMICIRVLGSRRAKLGDTIIAVVKESLPNTQIRRSEVVRAVVVRTRQEIKRENGSQIRFDDNAAVLINKEGTPRGSRVLGSISRELRDRNFAKIISLAKEIISR
jgi:large subunit ribosomal protein L14